MAIIRWCRFAEGGFTCSIRPLARSVFPDPGRSGAAPAPAEAHVGPASYVHPRFAEYNGSMTKHPFERGGTT
jgi:hypothetical protein